MEKIQNVLQKYQLEWEEDENRGIQKELEQFCDSNNFLRNNKEPDEQILKRKLEIMAHHFGFIMFAKGDRKLDVRNPSVFLNDVKTREGAKQLPVTKEGYFKIEFQPSNLLVATYNFRNIVVLTDEIIQEKNLDFYNFLQNDLTDEQRILYVFDPREKHNFIVARARNLCYEIKNEITKSASLKKLESALFQAIQETILEKMELKNNERI